MSQNNGRFYTFSPVAQLNSRILRKNAENYEEIDLKRKVSITEVKFDESWKENNIISDTHTSLLFSHTLEPYFQLKMVMMMMMMMKSFFCVQCFMNE